jgi:UDP-N-acetylglucosamine 1-carboxyvinyltransferase
MADLIVNGGKPLNGTITPSGNKNAVLPILCATLLSDAPVTLRNVPNITDIQKLVRFFQALGSKIEWDHSAMTLTVDHSGMADELGEAEWPQGMRSAVLLFAPMLRRLGSFEVPTEAKGCALGVRELDPHFEMLHTLGARVEREPLWLTLKDGFKGGHYWQDYMSVTTTENFVMAAVLARGNSTLVNAAGEPHVQDLCRFLNSLGAKIKGVGSSVLEIEGVEALGSGEVEIASDHHEITTFLALGAITGGQVRVEKAIPHHFGLINRAFGKLGVDVFYEGDTAVVDQRGPLKVQEPYTTNMLAKIEAAPWPYFPVDLLPLMVALAVRAEGVMHFWNKVYEGGFAWIPELVKFGAHVVTSDPHRIIVFGDKPLRPTAVEVPYIIRAAVALYMLAASIEGQSVVRKADPIRRAHPHFVENLQRLGAEVEWN